MSERTISDLFIRAQSRCLCENATAALSDAKQFGPLEVSVWSLRDDETGGHSGFAVKFVLPDGVGGDCYGSSVPKVEDMLNGLLWAAVQFVEFTWRNDE